MTRVAHPLERASADPCPATRRVLILAWACAGMMVLLPSPWKPPQMPLTSSVGSGAAALEHAEVGLTEQLRDTEVRAEGFLVERQPLELGVVLLA